MASPSNTNPQFPNITAPFVNSKGEITTAWRQLLTKLFNDNVTAANGIAGLTDIVAQNLSESILLESPPYSVRTA